MKHNKGTVSSAISRDRVHRTKMTIRRKSGREAITHYVVQQRIDSSLGKLTIYLYSTSNSSGYFLASYGDYPVGPKDANQAESVLDGVRDGIQTGSKSEIVSEKKILLDSYPGREITTRKTDQGEVVVFKWRVYLVGRRLYENAVGTLQKDSESPDIMKFLTSFDLNK